MDVSSRTLSIYYLYTQLHQRAQKATIWNTLISCSVLSIGLQIESKLYPSAKNSELILLPVKCCTSHDPSFSLKSCQNSQTFAGKKESRVTFSTLFTIYTYFHYFFYCRSGLLINWEFCFCNLTFLETSMSDRV